MFKRITFFLCVIILFLGAIFFSTLYKSSKNSTESENRITEAVGKPTAVWQIVPADAAHGRTISWLGKPNAEGKLELSYDGHDISYEASADSITPFDEDSCVYTVRLRSLEPATNYSYRVSSGEDYSDWYNFSTAGEPQARCSALIFGDSASADYKVWAKTANNAYKKNSDTDFFINMGNLTVDNSNTEEWQDWLDGIAAFSPEVPAAPVLGHNEVAGNNALPKIFQTLFKVPENSSYSIQKYAYSFDYGPVHFIVLDTQSEEAQAKQPGLLQDQAAWLEDDLSTTTLPWKVVLMHRSPWQPAPNNALNDAGKVLLPILNKYNVAAVLSASDHAYARTKEMSFGGGQVIFFSVGRSGDKTGQIYQPRAFDKRSFDDAAEPMYLKLTADEHNLAVMAYQQDGQTIDTWKINK